MESQSQHSSFYPVTNWKTWAKLRVSLSLLLLSVDAHLSICRGHGEVWRSKADLLEGLREKVMKGLRVLTKGGCQLCFPLKCGSEKGKAVPDSRQLACTLFLKPWCCWEPAWHQEGACGLVLFGAQFHRTPISDKVTLRWIKRLFHSHI